ncbi:MAG: hypothetical protein UX49_C0002G0005 [Candidatus Wolfebacteria bacterium GW2011_GWC2_46_275]|uniref:Uncharacterized protein n=1 Tax=Candidatus Wolfebacteria bacterium GW2011_GWA2_47_9b TaxID=1619005 RepID=A0A0G1WIJ3_9BACT|nr:MAG: hypothetical protein UX49_C0002G0005 [Candidatus Wolfebacteria bacterium GW2011_GWC2_46_275]KKU54344.1 MAG: hypothetical protein UX76_C0003G0040 [Candidatus Wolfebacteria bacterium GW2011_GWC1_47_103]KKU59531.1 MAG: hypothetical protein UX83_C0004G0033 [Candidatus Wolfebacteria bacterium GW2011_GWE2_47_12]KKU73566.1 MAG: hypothetical protein UX96_C0003G0004 [Candidatus Wolfebacteria bacterium GW2011_GWB1_47_243]KKU75435.1 MAG: hypothetical protein UY00_C0042G0005 [Candidatus Wolfebacter
MLVLSTKIARIDYFVKAFRYRLSKNPRLLGGLTVERLTENYCSSSSLLVYYGPYCLRLLVLGFCSSPPAEDFLASLIDVGIGESMPFAEGLNGILEAFPKGDYFHIPLFRREVDSLILLFIEGAAEVLFSEWFERVIVADAHFPYLYLTPIGRTEYVGDFLERSVGMFLDCCLQQAEQLLDVGFGRCN